MAKSMRSNAPIGAFDSGFGGLTVLREMISAMPNEDTIFIGDSANFPYGPKPLRDVRARVMRICSHLVDEGCKIIVIACNTATAAGLRDAQREFDVPIVGVVEPGSRAAVYATHTRKVGIIATDGTVQSGAYESAIHNLDAGIEVIQEATPELVEIAEAGIQVDCEPYNQALLASVSARLEPMRLAGIDTLVMGCTHFPLVTSLVQDCIGEDVLLVSSALETASEVRGILKRQKTCHAPRKEQDEPVRRFITTANDVEGFQLFASRVMGEVCETKSAQFESLVL